jgi:hypothetical protein
LVSEIHKKTPEETPPLSVLRTTPSKQNPWNAIADLATTASNREGLNRTIETLGSSSSLRPKLEHAWNNLTGAPTKLAAGLLRPNLHKKAICFIGDVLAITGHKEARDGAIATIREGILKAQDRAKTEKTIVIAHSMGGILMADMLFRKDPPIIDLLVTVGSQIAPIAELGHFGHKAVNDLMASPEGTVGPGSKATLPSVTRWINAYAEADFLGFRAEDVFSNAEEFSFVTGANPLSAHSDYFLRASFYARLARRITQGTRKS